MPSLRLLLWASLAAFPASLAAQEPPSYARQIKPFLAKYCLECHTGDRAKGGLDLTTPQGLLSGGNNGPALVPGKPDASRLVLQVEGKQKPEMPPKKARQPLPDEAALLRAWVAAGARDDSSDLTVRLPDVKPRRPVAAPVTALAFHPGGKLLAAADYQEVLLLDAENGDLLARITGHKGPVTALAFSANGAYLAAASGAPGTLAEVRVYDFQPAGSTNPHQLLVLEAHQDLVQDLAFAPDGRLLAPAGYDRVLKLWDLATGKQLQTLRDHSDAVYGVAFSPDGRLLASAAADRAVKVWDVATGRRLYTLGDATDWLYAVAWAPDGRHLAAAGVDRSIRVWQAGAESGRLVHSVFAHEAPVTHLAYAADGRTLYSLGEDRKVKLWDTAQMVERNVLPPQPDTVLGLALSPAGDRLALGRYDGLAVLLDAASGEQKLQLLPVVPKPPILTRVSPEAVRRGEAVRLTFEGRYLDQAAEVVTTIPGVALAVAAADRGPRTATVAWTVPPQIPAGVYQIGLKAPTGQTKLLPLIVDWFPLVQETGQNNAPSLGQLVSLSASIEGTLARAGEVDYYRFQATAGRQVGVQAFAAPASPLSPVLTVTDPTGAVLAEGGEGVLGFTAPRDGTYAVGIHDRDFRGGPAFRYRLQLGDVPVLTSVFPLGLQRGSSSEVVLQGVHLPSSRAVVAVPAGAEPGSEQPVPLARSAADPVPLGKGRVVVGEYPEVIRTGAGVEPVPVPGTANGRLAQPNQEDVWSFRAAKGQRLIVEVHARRLGSPLDSVLEITDPQGRPVPRATLRCLAKTYVTFRDHDSVGPNIRMEAWGEFAVNDYVYAGNELLRIQALPTHPDADCFFFSVNGQRVGYLDTTPFHLSLGTPMYKVTLHPPGTTFPPNGFPVIALYFRNDDGGPGYGKDSRVFFDPPADGEYHVRLRDARGFHGPDFAYRLTIRPPRPDFALRVAPASPTVPRGSAVPLTLTVDRRDGFDGPITLQQQGLPPGFSAPASTIPAGEHTTAVALFAEPGAKDPPAGTTVQWVARAVVQGRELVREASGGTPKVTDPGVLVTTTGQSELTLQPGGVVKLTVQIERRNGFKGRVPLDVKGLPHGVRVLDIGLNGILITESETRRTMELYAEPWVPPMQHPIVVLARHEAKGTEYAARSVLLRIGK